jgi:hypothetical protein
MKKLITILLIVISFSAKSQLIANVTAGRSQYSPVLQGELQYNLKKNWFVQGVLSSHLDREDPAFVGARVGYNFQFNEEKTLFIQPLYGYHLIWTTLHNSRYNHYDFGCGGAIVYKNFKFEVYGIDRYEFIGVGITGLSLK